MEGACAGEEAHGWGASGPHLQHLREQQMSTCFPRAGGGGLRRGQAEAVLAKTLVGHGLLTFDLRRKSLEGARRGQRATSWKP